MWDEVREKARAEIQAERSLSIIGTDADPEVLKLARIHAKNAGVEQQIHFQEKAFSGFRNKRLHGCVITNPPYGQRLEEQRDLRPLYESFPSVLQRVPTWSHFIITSFPHFEKVIQKSASRRRKLFNGRIECTYYQFLGPKPSVRAAADVTDMATLEISNDDVSTKQTCNGRFLPRCRIICRSVRRTSNQR